MRNGRSHDARRGGQMQLECLVQQRGLGVYIESQLHLIIRNFALISYYLGLN